MTANIIEAKQITKRFGDIVAVDGISLSIPQGEIFGLLGPNAAGKSTVIRLLSGILRLDAGSAAILDYDLATQTDAIKKRIGYVSQFFALYPELTVAENLVFYSAIYSSVSREKQNRLLSAYGLRDVANQRSGLLSGGYKRRLSIVCALAHEPELIFLDEPTAGIDPVTRKELWEQFYVLAAEGKTLFVTTHYMEEAERCNRLAFIHHGRLVAEGSPSAIISTLANRRIYTAPIRHHAELAAALSLVPGVLVLNQFGDQLRIITDQSTDREALNQVLVHFGGVGTCVSDATASIEDAFISLTHEEQD